MPAAERVAVIGGQHDQVLAQIDCVQKAGELIVRPSHRRPILGRAGPGLVPDLIDINGMHQGEIGRRQ